MNILKVYLVDDEELALKRLERLLLATGRVEIVGKCIDPVKAVEALGEAVVDLLFLDVEMPGMNGFELLAMLARQPLTIFATAYSQYALEAFATHSIDYLVKPIERERLGKALDKAERLLESKQGQDWQMVVSQLAQSMRPAAYPTRIASKLGDRVELVEVSLVTHFFAEDKLTYAAAGAKNYVVNETISELEQKLDPQMFFQIHRSTLLNLNFVHELHGWVGGGILVRLKDALKTELQVARERVAELKRVLIP